jgi:hypothetical protein
MGSQGSIRNHAPPFVKLWRFCLVPQQLVPQLRPHPPEGPAARPPLLQSHLIFPKMPCLSLSCFGRKTSRSKNRSSMTSSIQEGDPAISAPWGFKVSQSLPFLKAPLVKDKLLILCHQHHTHVDEAFQGVPPELEEEFRRALITKGLSIPAKKTSATTSFNPIYSGQ